MDNENKELQNGLNEAELEEKVRQDVSEKIRDAAAELEEEIAEADAVTEENDVNTEEVAEAEDEESVVIGYPIDGEAEPVIVGYDEEGNPIFAEEEEAEEVKEPKWISMKLRNMILYLVGAAAVGALILFFALSIPKWMEEKEASKSLEGASDPLAVEVAGDVVAEVNGVAVSDEDLEFYIYREAQTYISENGGVISDPAEFDWDTEVEEGKTAGDIVKENALRAAIENVLLIEAGKKEGVEWNQEMEAKYVEGQIYMMSKTYGEELVELNALAQGYGSMEQYKRLMVRESYAADIAEDLTENPDKYYPDMEELKAHAATDGATVKHILIAFDDMAMEDATASTEGEVAEEAPVDKRIMAEEILKKAQEGEDFDALVREFNEDKGMPDTGYFVDETASFVPEFKAAALALEMNEVSGIVETEYGYHIIKRIPGEMDLFNYWRGIATIDKMQDVLDNISVTDVVTQVTKKMDEFNARYKEYQEENASMGY